jgi:hypothetical protein
MRDAVDRLVEQVPFSHQKIPKFRTTRTLYSHYMFMFYSAPFISDILPDLETTSQHRLQQIVEIIDRSHGHEYELARSHAEIGLVSRHHLMYLICPCDVLIHGTQPESSQAWISTKWLEMPTKIDKVKQPEEWRYTCKQRTITPGAMFETAGHEEVMTCGWELDAWA